MSKSKLSTDPTSIANSYPWWLYIVIITGAILLTSGAVLSKANPSLLTNGADVTAATRVFADYTFARDLGLMLLLLFLLVIKSGRLLAGMMVLSTLIQILDMINDLIRGDFVLVPVVLVFAIAFLVGASKVLGQPIWRIDSWRERDSHLREFL